MYSKRGKSSGQKRMHSRFRRMTCVATVLLMCVVIVAVPSIIAVSPEPSLPLESTRNAADASSNTAKQVSLPAKTPDGSLVPESDIPQVYAEHEQQQVLVTFQEGYTAEQLTQAIQASGCTLPQAITPADTEAGFATLRVADSYDVEHAKTLHELGLLRASSIKSAMRRKTVFARTVKCVGEEEYLAEQKQKREAFEAEQAKIENKLRRKKWRDVPYRYDFSTDRFYIPEDKVFGALTLFNKKGTNPLNFIFVIVICIALMVLCCYLLPEMVQLADNFVGVFVEE